MCRANLQRFKKLRTHRGSAELAPGGCFESLYRRKDRQTRQMDVQHSEDESNDNVLPQSTNKSLRLLPDDDPVTSSTQLTGTTCSVLNLFWAEGLPGVSRTVGVVGLGVRSCVLVPLVCWSLWSFLSFLLHCGHFREARVYFASRTPSVLTLCVAGHTGAGG